MTLKLESTTTWTHKRLKLGIVSSFDPHNMCAKVERITTKTGCTSCTNWSFSFKVQGLSDENSCVTKTFHFSKHISTQDYFCIQHATFKATYLNFNRFLLHLLFFMHLMIYFELNDPIIGKHYNLNSEKIENWHGIII